MASTPSASRAAQRRRRTLERRRLSAAEVVDPGASPGLPALSVAAQSLLQAAPHDLQQRGLIQFDPQGQPKVGLYAPSLLAPNPQRGRVLDRGIDELAQSLDAHGQQEPIVARLITQTDRQRWPDAFRPDQILLILKGHRLYYAQPRSKVRLLRVELMLPREGEDDLTYGRRAMRRAAIKMMHSQSYDIFDKVNLYHNWCQEFTLEQPTDSKVAGFFEISRSEAQRLKVVSQLDPKVAQEILNSDRRPADEVVFHIANRPVNEHAEAFRRYGHLTVAAVRRLEQKVKEHQAEGKVAGPGRPRNYVLTLRDESSPIAYLATRLTAQQWKGRGGAQAFRAAVQELLNDPALRSQLEDDLD